MRFATLLLALALPVVAQTPAAPVKDTPQLTKTEVLALSQLRSEFSQANELQKQASADLNLFMADVTKSHPGYTFDPQSGTLVLLPKHEDNTKAAIPDKK